MTAMVRLITILLCIWLCNAMSAQKIGLLTNTPDAPVHIASSGSVNVDGGLLLLGNRSEGNMQLDFNYIQSSYGQFGLDLRINPFGGNVGIHTQFPDAVLHVATSGELNTPGGILMLGNRNLSHMEMDFDIIQAKYNTGTLPLRIQPNGGHTGINTFLPQAPLHVYSSGLAPTTGGLVLLGNSVNGHMQVDYDLIQTRFNANASTLRIQPNGGNINMAAGDLFVNAASNMVGIMDATPSYTLDVNGNIGLAEYLYHKSDDNTNLRFTPDQIFMEAGGRIMLDCFNGLLDYVKIGDDNPLNIFLNDAMMVSSVDNQVAIGTDHLDPTARLHIKGSTSESALKVQTNNQTVFECESDQDVVIGGWGYAEQPNLIVRYPLWVWNSADDDKRPAISADGYQLEGAGGFMEGGMLEVGGSGQTILMDNDEILSWHNTNHELTTLKLNRRGGNVVLGHDTYSKVGVKTVGEPSSDLHVFQTFSAGNSQSGIRLESPNFDHWRMAINNSDHLEMYYNGTLRATLSSVNGGWSAPSDSRLKKDIQTAGSLLGKVKQLRPVTYHMKEQNENEPLIYGFIAQEMQEIFPEVVMETSDGKLALHYEQIAVLAVKALQELSDENEELKGRVSEMEKRLAKIESMLVKK